MDYIHQQRIVHMDLAAKSCLLHTGSTIKISDLGIAMPYDEGADYYTLNGRLKLSLRWLAPETYSLEKKLFNEMSDVWSFGITLWEIICYGTTPYGKLRLNEVHRLVPKGLRLQVPEKCPVEFKELLVSCWAADPAQRKNFAQLAAELNQMVAKYSAEGQRLRDIGASINKLLSERLHKMSVRAHTIKKKRTDQEVMSGSPCPSPAFLEQSAGGVPDFVRRSNPLFGQNVDFSFDDDNDDDDEQPAGDSDSADAPANGAPRHNPPSGDSQPDTDDKSLVLKTLAVLIHK